MEAEKKKKEDMWLDITKRAESSPDYAKLKDKIEPLSLSSPDSRISASAQEAKDFGFDVSGDTKSFDELTKGGGEGFRRKSMMPGKK